MIENLNLKLKGELPISRIELFELVSSWGRKNTLQISFGGNKIIKEEKCEPNNCYPLENLDVSKLNNLSFIFRHSMYNGDLSKWDISNCINIDAMFDSSDFNNNSISNWNVSHIIKMSFLFLNGKFDGDISSWKFNKNLSCDYMFYGNENFENKYNDGKRTLEGTKNILKWFEENRDKMRELNLSEDKVLNFFSFESNLDKDIK